MKRIIYKYPLVFIHEQDILLPDDIEPLSVQLQKGTICLWGLTSPGRPELRKLWIVGTGHAEVPERAQHIGTVQIDEFVWHVFLGAR